METAVPEAFLLILATELGDKTFLIQALMAARNRKWAVYIASLAVMWFMTVLGTLIGSSLNYLLNPQLVEKGAHVAFFIFGVMTLKEAYFYEEQDEDIELPKASNNFIKVAIKTASLVFIAEWADKSQLSTIALSAAHDAWCVVIGACLGHLVCTSLAVGSGEVLAKHVSERVVAGCCGVLFIVFALI
mmetsp:Transcript_5362/g.9862  ORF Transcript_5362/g.9862 Transcript_5362/m.9862 type:complete len:188 (+) Transcript_5362:1658-2221(+)